MPGNLMIGLPVSGLMMFGRQLVDDVARKLTLFGWRYPLSILPTIRRTWFWIGAAHGLLDRDQQQKDFRNILSLMVNDRILPLQQIPCVHKLRNRNLLESCIFGSPTTPPFSTMVDVLETGDVLFF